MDSMICVLLGLRLNSNKLKIKTFSKFITKGKANQIFLTKGRRQMIVDKLNRIFVFKN